MAASASRGDGYRLRCGVDRDNVAVLAVMRQRCSLMKLESVLETLAAATADVEKCFSGVRGLVVSVSDCL
ncbi:hypothetical protein [Nitrosomonas sp.]|uniref:hypothetical protein n=1 Tax=Nitrosomonas sp. TaxID=42353 RepID=UPI0032F02CC4